MLDMFATVDRCHDPRDWHNRWVDIDGGSEVVEERINDRGCDFIWREEIRHLSFAQVTTLPKHLACDESWRFYRCTCVTRADFARYDFDKSICALNEMRLSAIAESLKSLRAADWSCGSFDGVRCQLDTFRQSALQASSDAMAVTLSLDDRAQSLKVLRAAFERRSDGFDRHYRDELARVQTMLGTCDDAGVLAQLDELARERFVTPSEVTAP